MATYTITVESIVTTQAMGGDLQLWGTMVWATDPWGITDEEYATAHKVLSDSQASSSDASYLEVHKLISESQASSSDASYLEVHKFIDFGEITISSIDAKTFIHDPIDAGSIGSSSEAENMYLKDGVGFYYVFAGAVTDGDKQVVMDYQDPASITTSYSQSSGATPVVSYTSQSAPTV